jgi:hypothetical protein
MRFYNIVISDPTTGRVLVSDPSGATGFVQAPSNSATTGSGAPVGFDSPTASVAGVSTFTSLVNGLTIPGALNIELDIPVIEFATPRGAAHLKVWGVGLKQIGQSSDLNGKDISITAGMAKGLPLANPAQAGLVMEGTIFQAYGNWEGTNQSLEFVLYPKTGSPDDPMNLVINWKAGMPLATAIANTLQTAFPTYKQVIGINPNLVLPNDEPGYHQTLTQFAQYIKSISQNIIGGNYGGVSISVRNGVFYVFDGTTPTTPKEIAFTDLIGQPTWTSVATIQFACVMRADLQVDDYITLPQAQITTSAQSYSQYRNSLIFQGKFRVQSIRHVGNFRQADALSWLTIVEAYTVPPGPGAATTGSGAPVAFNS